MDRKIVEFRLGTSDISAVRFGISPGYELVNAVRTLLRPQASPLQWGWLRTVQQRARTESFRLLAVVCGAEGYMPDFLTSTPSGDMTPEEELARLREVPDERLRLDLQKRVVRSTGAQQQELRDLLAHPRQARAAIADAWWQTWEELLAPVWPQLLRLLRADIAVRARRSSDAGLAHMAAGLHSTVTWGDEVVRVQMRRHEEVVDCGGTGLVLVPSVMMPTRGCAVLTEHPRSRRSSTPPTASPRPGTATARTRSRRSVRCSATSVPGWCWSCSSR